MAAQLRPRAIGVRAGLLFACIAAIPALIQHVAGGGLMMPHGFCIRWQPALLALHVSSDAIIGLSYIAISVTLAAMTLRIREKLPFPRMILTFGAFIVACGLTHLAEIWTMFRADYWFLGTLKAATAAVSVAAAITLPQLFPHIRRLIDAAQEAEQSASALRRSEAEFRGIFENAHDAIMIFDPADETILEANPAACATYRVSREDFIGRSLREFSTNVELGEQRVRQTLANREPMRFETRQRRADGAIIYIEVSASVVMYGGRPCILSMNHDITERTIAQRQLVESEMRLSEAQRLAHVADWVWRPETNELTGSAELYRIFDLPEARHQAEAWTSRVHPDDLPSLQREVRGALRGGPPFAVDFRIVGADGQTRWTHARGRAEYEAGTLVALAGTAQDVTALKVLDEERETFLNRLTLLLESTGEAIIGLDVDGVCVFANGAATDLLAADPGTLIGCDVHRLVHPSAEECGAEECAIATVPHERTASRSGWLCTATGKRLRVNYSIAPMVERGVVRGSVLVFTDETQKHALETQLEQTKRLSSIGRLAATMAHEFNNVLMGVQSMGEVIGRRATQPEKVVEASRSIGDFVRRGKRVTEVVLKYARPVDPVKAPIDLDRWLDRLTPQLESILRNGVVLRVVRRFHGEIVGDVAQLGQVLSNLVLNACDAMPDGGEITLVVEQGSLPPETGRDYVRIAVHDTGTGIPADLVDHIFEPLVTTKRNGTGLGLSVAHQVVTAHDGTIEVETEVGRGTTFACYLPAASSAAGATAEVELPQLARGTRLLVVEDDAAVSGPVTELLAAEGMTVVLAERGADAEAYLTRSLPDAIILDINLPDMNGADLFRRLRMRRPDLPVVFSSGHVDDATMEPMLQQRRTLLLRKPYEFGELLHAVRRVLDGDGGAHEVS